MDNKSIIDRATKALFAYENSKPNEVTAYDAMYKANEALRLVRDLAASMDLTTKFVDTQYIISKDDGQAHANQ